MKKHKIFSLLLATCVFTTSLTGVHTFGAEGAAPLESDVFGDGSSENLPENEEAMLFSDEKRDEDFTFTDTEVEEELLNPEGILQAGDTLNEEMIALAASLDPKVKAAVKKQLKICLSNCDRFIDLTEYKLTKKEFNAVIQEVLNELPGFNFAALEGVPGATSNGLICEVYPKYKYDKKTCFQMMDKFNNVIADFKSGVQPGWSDLEKAMYAHDYLVLNCRYAVSFNDNSAFGALIEGTAVCQGYMLAYGALLDELGIENQYVTCDEMHHAWNLVKLDSKWYYVDVTSDDPMNALPEYDSYKYFLKSDKGLGYEDEGKFVFSNGGYKGIASDTRYDDYVWKDAVTNYCYLNGCWYGNEKGEIRQYQAENNQLKYVKTIREIPDLWAGTWGKFSSLAQYGDKLYFTTPTRILAYDVNSNTEAVFYELSDEEKRLGTICGMKINRSGILTYDIAQDIYSYSRKQGTIKLHEHSFTSKTTKKTTCGTAGRKVYTCTVCGYQKTETYAATGKHKFGKWKIIEKATCIGGNTLKRTCSVCGYAEHDYDSKTGPHKMYVSKVYKKANPKNMVWGKYKSSCEYCKFWSTEDVFPPYIAKVSNATLKYNGKVQKPAVTVLNVDRKKIASSNYTVTYPSGCKKPGTYKVKITFKGKLYSGTMYTTYKIVK